MVYRVELNLATHTLVMSERNNGTLEHRKGSVNQGRGEAQIQTFHQFDKIKLPFLPTSSTRRAHHYDYGTKYNFRLRFFQDHPAFEIAEEEIRELSNN